jgi:hypothetical protein
MEGLFDRRTKEKLRKHTPVEGLVHKQYVDKKTGIDMKG